LEEPEEERGKIEMLVLPNVSVI